ncbi:ABC-2 transporter permease [Mycoplasmopsis cricetuli]|uniref:ABC transporter permease n=1 Tax=Mycoplasmopsis cricetuli TaxID=171283 RepID=UPI0004711141|nr:ABC transporter permease [Mycoplasmopsis cricetuli]
MKIFTLNNFQASYFYLQNIFRKKIFWILFLVSHLLILVGAVTFVLILKAKGNKSILNYGIIAISLISMIDLLFIFLSLQIVSKLFYSDKTSNNEIMLIARSFTRKNLILNKFLCFICIGIVYSLFAYVLKIIIFLVAKEKLLNYANWYYLSIFLNLLFYFFFGSFFMLLKTKLSFKTAIMILTGVFVSSSALNPLASLIPTKANSFKRDIENFERFDIKEENNEISLQKFLIKDKNDKLKLIIAPGNEDNNIDRKTFSEEEKTKVQNFGNNLYILRFIFRFLSPTQEFLFYPQRNFLDSSFLSSDLEEKNAKISFVNYHDNWENDEDKVFYLSFKKDSTIIHSEIFEYFFNLKFKSIFKKNAIMLKEQLAKKLKITTEEYEKMWDEFILNEETNNTKDFTKIKNLLIKFLEDKKILKLLNDNETFLNTLSLLYLVYPESNFIQVFIKGILDNNNQIEINNHKFSILLNNKENEQKLFKEVNEIFVYKEKTISTKTFIIIFMLSLSLIFMLATYFNYLRKDNF